MANDNGGIIGIINTPTANTASGVWSIDSQYQAQTTGTWPPIPSLGVNSARFNKASGDYLNRTQGTPTSRRTFTYSGWIKLSTLNVINVLFQSANGSNDFVLNIQNNSEGNDLRVYNYQGSLNLDLRTSQAFRDVLAWYHIVLAVDTTQGTASNRVKMYVNGEQVTSFSTATYPSQNFDTGLANGVPMQIGRIQSTSDYFDGYMSDVNFVDGQQLAPTSFGAFNANGVWTPIIPAVTYGTNGFRLKFGNASNLGEDSSPNGNNFTVNSLTSLDQSADYPVNNFSTMNALDSINVTLSEGNLSASCASSSGVRSTIGVTTGLWYSEVKYQNTTSVCGVTAMEQPVTTFNGIGAILFGQNGAAPELFLNGATPSTYANAGNFSANDILQIALNMNTNTVYFGKNGSWFGGTSWTASTPNTGHSLTSGYTYGVRGSTGSGTSVNIWNFGHPPYAISSGNADANGYGNFEYTVPSGYYSLCTKNLAEFG